MSRQSELAELSRVYDSSPLSNRNLLINGACQVWQRGTSFSGNSAYNADRWYVDNNSGGGGQSTDAPDGFTYSLKIDPSSGDAAPRQAIELPAAGEGGVFRSGQKLTLSFYLKSDNAGEAINIFAASGTAVTSTTTAQVNDTSTGLTTTTSWTRYTYTFTSNNVGGSDTCYNIVPYVGSPSGDTYWTGFQLELGDTATPFEHRSYADQLQSCSRYFQKIEVLGSAGSYAPFPYTGLSRTSTIGKITCGWTTPLRTAPTITTTAANTFAIPNGGGSSIAVASISMGRINALAAFIEFTVASGLTVGQATYLNTNNTADPSISVDAEF